MDHGMTLTRKRRKPRARGTGCQMGRVCIAVGEYNGRRMCGKHLADALFAAKVRSADRCWAEGAYRIACNGGLQCAHILSRRYKAVRWDQDNAVALCMAHHVWFTHHPLEWEDWCKTHGVPWDELRQQALNEPPMDPMAVVETLRGTV